MNLPFVRRSFFALGILSVVCGAVFGEPRARLDLNGAWDFYPDIGAAPLEAVTKFPSAIQVPGAWQAQGYGQAGGPIPSANIGPGTSPADYLRHNLMARCLYVRDVPIPAEWQGQRMFLCVRRAYRYTDVSINGKRIGEYEGFSSPFEFDVTDAIVPGATSRLVLGVDNQPRPGRDTLGTANLYGNWGGIGGAVYLETRPPVRLTDVFAMPQIANGRALLRVRVNESSGAAALQVRAQIRPWSLSPPVSPTAGSAEARLPEGQGEVMVELPVAIADVRLWTPQNPFLYLANVQLISGGQVLDELQVRFGMREITAQGNKLLLNGKPLYLSGYGDDATEPLTGMLPANKALYRQRLGLMRKLGFNFVRHHSCVPHDEYLEAADEVGMLVQPEAGLAYTGFWRTGHLLFQQEWPNIVRAFRNHPSVWAWCMGNELFLNELPEAAAAPADATAPKPGGVSRGDVLALIDQGYHQAHELDPTRLVHASDGGTPQPNTDVLSNGGPEKSTKPYLLHEYGTYCCSLPDFSLIPRLNGVIAPLTYQRAERYVTEHRLQGAYRRLYESSLMMRADAQKFYIEAAKNDPANAGYSFWLGVDFPDSPEGCWDEGVLNQLWEPKPYLTNNLPDVNGTTVLLTSAGLEARSFYADQGKTVGIRLWHYGAEPIRDARLSWRLTENNRVLQTGQVPGIQSELGQVNPVAELRIDPLRANAPRFLKLQVQLIEKNIQLARNDWELFAYPQKPVVALPGVYSEAGPLPGATEIQSGAALPENMRVLITRGLKRERHREWLQRGHVAVLLLGTGGFKESRAGYFLNQYGTGFGGIIEEHPIFEGIPHQGRLHLGLHQLVAGGGVLDTEAMPAALREGTIVWGLRLTGWISPVKNLRKVAHMCEVLSDNQVNLLLCNLDLTSDKPESRYVLSRALDYLVAGVVPIQTKQCLSRDLETLLQ